MNNAAGLRNGDVIMMSVGTEQDHKVSSCSGCMWWNDKWGCRCPNAMSSCERNSVSKAEQNAIDKPDLDLLHGLR